MEPETIGVKLSPAPTVAIFKNEAKPHAEVFGAERPDRDVTVGEPGKVDEPFIQETNRIISGLLAEAGTFYRRFEVMAIVVELMQVGEPPGVFVPVALSFRQSPG